MGMINRQTRLGIFFLLVATAGICAAEDVQKHETPEGEVLNFALLDHHGRLYELRRMGSKAVVLFFTANDCPVARQSASKLKVLREKYGERGVSIFLVNSSLADSRKYISKEAADLGIWHIPVLK